MGSFSPEQALTAAWRAVAEGRRGDAERAWLEAIPPTRKLRATLAYLWLAWGEPLRAIALIDGSELDEDDPCSIVVHAIRSNLLGEPERARAERAKLVALAGRLPSKRSNELLLLAGWMAEEACATDEAWERFREVAEAQNRFCDWTRAARALVASGTKEAFLELAGELTKRGDEKDTDLIRLAELCERAGAHELAMELYERVAKIPQRSEPRLIALLALARLSIWKLSLDGARAQLAKLEDAGASEKEMLGLRAALELFENRPEEALSMLDDLASRWPESRDLQFWLLRTDAALQAGHLEEAERSMTQANLIETTFAAQLLHARLRLALEGLRWWQIAKFGPRMSLLWLSRKGANRLRPLRQLASAIDARAGRLFERLNPEIGTIVAQLSEPLEQACQEDAKAAVAVLDDLRAQLGGNRTSTPTRRVRSADGEIRLEGWRLPPNDRQASSSLLHRLGRETPEAILRQFESLASKFPASPFPFTYQGELRLWLGDYAGAQENFEEALRRRSTRWAYVGLAAVATLEGRTRRANRLLKKSVLRFGELPSATTYVYRGELRRRVGDYTGALQDLELALRYRPRRVAARMNLALTLSALGRRSEADAELRRAASLLPGVFRLAADALSRPLPTTLDIDTTRPFIERAFELMRGNRSSWMHTAFDKDGGFRILPITTGWQALAKRELSRVRRAAEQGGPGVTSIVQGPP